MGNGPDTGEKELIRIIQFLKGNGYTYECVGYAEVYCGYIDATFTKPIRYTYIDGNCINDSHTSVTVQFEDRFDYKNIETNEDGDYIYDITKADKFIQSIYDNA